MEEFCISLADKKSENTKHTTKYDNQTSCTFWSKELVEGSKRRTLFHGKTFVKGKNGLANKPPTLT